MRSREPRTRRGSPFRSAGRGAAALLAAALACATPTGGAAPEKPAAQAAAPVAAAAPAAPPAEAVKPGDAPTAASAAAAADALLDPLQGQGATALPEPTPEEKAKEQALTKVEAGDDEDDAAPEGFVSRASGRPDHPRSLEEIKASGYIRVLTRNNDTSFFIHRGHRMGFDYELGKALAQRMGIRVDMVITQDWSEMFPALLRGEGDVIAAQVTITPERAKEVQFARPWGRTREVVVWKDGTPPIRAIDDLAGKTMHVRKGSTYFQTLTGLNAQFAAAGKPTIDVKIVPEEWETDTILAGVARGEIVYTLADSLLADITSAHFDNLVSGPPATGERDLAWAVRPGENKLAREIDAMFHDLRKKPLFNVLRKKYFEADREFQRRTKDKFYASETGTLSPYDPMVMRYAEEHGFDWRLVASQIYQESHFDPKKRSHVGATGLFQIMPATARGLGIRDATDPEQSIRGGLKYMLQLAKHYDDVPDEIERYRFALAAYNAGFGHVDDARKLARAAKKDDKKWREVAPWLLKLSDRKWHSKVRFGYCRGAEPVDYVRSVDERYAGYVQLVPLKKTPRPAIKASNP